MAEEIKQTLGFDASQALTALKQLDDALAALENGLRGSANNFGTFNKEAGKTVSAMIQLAQRSNEAAAALAKVASAGGLGRNISADAGAAATAAAQVAKSFLVTGDAARTASVRVGDAIVRISKHTTNAADQVTGANGRLTTSFKLLSRIVFTQTIVSGFRAIRQGIEESIQASIAFQKQLAEIQSIDTDKIFGNRSELGSNLQRISSDFNIPLPDVAKGTYEALSAQILKTAQDLQFMTTAAEFSKGALTTMDASVRGLAGGLNAYGQGVDQADRLASQFNETIRLGTIRGEELASNFGTVATLGNTLGVSQAELLSSVAALTNAGVPYAQAFTQIRGTLTGLVKPSDELTRVFRANGIASAEQLVKTRGLGGALKFLLEQTDGTTAGTAELFNNQRALLGVLSLGGTNAEKYADTLRQIDGVTSRLNSERAQQVMANDAEQLTKKWNQLKVTMIPIGDGFVTIGNTGLDTAAVLRDFTVAVLDTTGSILRAQPRVTAFGIAWENLQALFGKDLTIGESGGKIISELEIRQRQLDIIGKKRETVQKAQAAAEGKAQEELNKIRFAEIDQFKARNKELLAEARTSANAIINVEKGKITQLTQQINLAKNLIKTSGAKVAGLTARQDRRDFDTRLGQSNLDDSQKSFALIKRAQDLASKAATDLATAARTGSVSGVERARAAFETAQATGEEAKQLAESAGDRRGALFAARQLKELTDLQVNSEKQLASISASRLPQLEQQRAKQQQSLAIIQAATKTLAANSSIFDKNGQQLSPEALKAQAAARQGALGALLEQGVSKDKVLDLQIRTDGAVSKLETDLSGALGKIDASPLARALGNATGPATTLHATIETLQTPMQANAQAAAVMAQALQAAASASSAIKVPILGGGPTANQAFGGRPSFFAAGGRGIDTVPAMLARGETVINPRSSNKFFSQLQAINAGHAPVFRQNGGSTTNVGDVNVTIKSSDPSKINGREIGRALRQEIRRGNIRFKS